MRGFYFLLLLTVVSYCATAQTKRIAIIGSSTAQGVGADPLSNSWVNRLQAFYRRNTSDGIDTSITPYNIAIGGAATIDGLPTGMGGDPSYNITRALSFSPAVDVILVSYVSNDAAYGYTITETMENLRTIFNTAVSAGKKCFISTTQPRDFASSATRQLQKDTRDSIIQQFGVFSLNFWDDVVNPSTTPANLYTLNPIYGTGDGIHINNEGHNKLFQQVSVKDLFNTNLPIVLQQFSAVLKRNKIELNWQAETDDNFDKFVIERSNDGRTFSSIANKKAANTGSIVANYQFTDEAPVSGYNYYRLALTSKNAYRQYSKVIRLAINNQKFSIRRIYSSSAGITLEIDAKEKQNIEIQVVNNIGQVLTRVSKSVNESSTITLPNVTGGKGIYFVRVVGANGEAVVQSFLKE